MLARRAVDDQCGSVIATGHGKGYRFVATVSEEPDSREPVARNGRIAEVNQDDGEATPSTRLPGRTQELAFLQRAFEQAGAGRGRLVVVSGDAGTGKTALVERFGHELERAGVFVAWGRCWRRSEAPRLWPWLEIVRSCVAAVEAEGLAERAQRVLGELELASERDAPPGARDVLVFDAVVRFLAELGRARSVVVMIEDLSFADQTSLALLEFLRERVRSTSLLVVVTRRLAEPEFDAPFDEAGRNVESLLLSPWCAEAMSLLPEQHGHGRSKSPLADERGNRDFCARARESHARAREGGSGRFGAVIDRPAEG